MKLDIEKFKFVGEIYIWKYTNNTKNYPGWNLTLNKEAAQNLLKLFDLMLKSEWSAKKNIQTAPVTQFQADIPQNRNSNWKSKPKILFKYNNNDLNEFWQIIETDDCVEILFGKEKLYKLKESIHNIISGKSDFAISDSNEDNILYFW